MNGCYYDDEIKVNEYIRTIDGFIDKVIIDYKGKCNNPNCLEKHISCELDYYCEKEIVKHSSNIIDLIEVGDYVNGDKVIDIAQGKIKAIYTQNQEQKLALIPIVKEQIESIVTHEQFKSIEYTIHEREEKENA